MQKSFFLFMITLLLLSCNNLHNSSNGTDSEFEDTAVTEEAESSFSDMIDVVSVETGWYDSRVPQVKVKFKNVSGKSIDDYIKVKYQFIEADEIIFEDNHFLHTGSQVAWDNGLIKTETFRSTSGYLYGGPRHVVRAKICYDDNSVIWEGNIGQRVI